MEDQIYAKLDVKDNEGNIVGFAFVEREKITHAGSLSIVPKSSPQGQKEEGSVSLEDDLDLSFSEDDEDLQQSSQVQQMSSSQEQRPGEEKEELLPQWQPQNLSSWERHSGMGPHAPGAAQVFIIGTLIVLR